MGLFVGKILVAAFLIAMVSHLAGKQSALAGFLTALPLTSMIALVFVQLQWGDSLQTINYAKSIFFAIPISLMFFLPFFLPFSFWICYASGVILLGLGYFVHQLLLSRGIF